MAKKASIQEINVGEIAWPGFTDILSSTILVLAFTVVLAGLIMSMSQITKNRSKVTGKQSSDGGANRGGEGTQTGDHGGLKEELMEATLLADFAKEFQRLVVMGKPLAPHPTELEPKPLLQTEERKKPQYNIREADIISDFERVTRPGVGKVENQGTKETLKDQPAYEVLEELVLRQQDIIAQQRKVIERQDEETVQQRKQYQSLLALYSEMQKEVEDVYQKSTQTQMQARYVETPEGDRLSGPSEIPSGMGTYAIHPAEAVVKTVRVERTETGLILRFDDNAPFLMPDKIGELEPLLANNISVYNANGVVLSSKRGDFAMSGTEAQRISLERMLVIRAMLIEMGVEPTKIQMEPIRERNRSEDKDYGWLRIDMKKGQQ